MTTHSRWLIHDSSNSEQLLEQIQKKYTLEPMQLRHETLTFFDDFEWHLWRNDQLLASNNQGVVMRIAQSQLDFFAHEPSPVFAHHFTQSALREPLHKLTRGRRLFPMAELEVEFCHYAIRNKDLKKVCDLHIILTGYGTMAELKSLRGYEKEYQQCLKLIRYNTSAPLEQHIFHKSLNLLGIQPSEYRAKPKFNLTPELDSCDATALIAQKLWHNVRANEEGIIRDWDTGFLHQYRVALRRLRALFSQMKGSIGAEESQWFRTQLSQLAQRTNTLRDMDVFLASEENYISLIPSTLKEGMRQLFKELARERQTIQKQLAETLRSPEYQAQISLIESRLALCPATPPKKGRKAILKIAARQIKRRYDGICLDAAGIHQESPDENVHEVRLGCKKLRYLLEFFGQIFPKSQIKPVLKCLKQLQDNLGRFNDYSVQRERLDTYLKNRKNSPETEAAIHALGGILFNRQKNERARVERLLAEFMAPQIQEQVESLLQGKALVCSEKTGSSDQ